MANNGSANPKLLKIFTPVRCLNRDQLPRYIEGKLTDLEKHLVEQHLVDCDLCNEAMRILENETHRSRYATLVGQLQQYIHVNIRPESQVKKKETAIRKERNRESLLAVFWLVATVVLIAGGVYVYNGFQRQQRNTGLQPIAQTSAAIPANTASDLEHPAAHHADPVKSTPAPAPAAVQAPLTAAPPPAAAAPARKPDSTAKAPVPVPATASTAAPKDSAKAAPKKPADTAAKTPAVAKAPDSAKKTLPSKPDDKNDDKTPPKKDVAKTEAPKPEAPKKTDDTPPGSSLDEFMYKAARVSQQDGDLNEAIVRYKNIINSGAPKYVEMSKYQMAQCYKAQGHHAKAKRLFKEVVKMNGSLKTQAQAAIDSDKSDAE